MSHSACSEQSDSIRNLVNDLESTEDELKGVAYLGGSLLLVVMTVIGMVTYIVW